MCVCVCVCVIYIYIYIYSHSHTRIHDDHDACLMCNMSCSGWWRHAHNGTRSIIVMSTIPCNSRYVQVVCVVVALVGHLMTSLQLHHMSVSRLLDGIRATASVMLNLHTHRAKKSNGKSIWNIWPRNCNTKRAKARPSKRVPRQQHSRMQAIGIQRKIDSMEGCPCCFKYVYVVQL